MRTKVDHIAAILVLPRKKDATSSVIFMFGFLKWTRDSVTLTARSVSPNDFNSAQTLFGINLDFSCNILDKHENCVRKLMLTESRDMLMMIASIINRPRPTMDENVGVKDWVATKITICEHDVYGAWFVYKPHFHGIVSMAVSSVALDCSSKWIRQRFKWRLQF